MPKDKVVFHERMKEDQKEFKDLRNLLFEDIENAITSYEEEEARIKDPKNNESQSNIAFERLVCIDHIIMSIQRKVIKKE